MVRLGLLVRVVIGLCLMAGVMAADPLPVAPPPREAKPAKGVAADLLIGTWKMVKYDGEPFPPQGTDIRFEFTADRRICIRVVGRKPRLPRQGMWRIDAKGLHYNTVPNGDMEAMNWTVTILDLSQSVLRLEGRDGGKPFRMEFQRLDGKPTDR